MSKYTITTASNSVTDGPLQTQTAIVKASGTWGGGTLAISAVDEMGNEVELETTTSDYIKEVVFGKNRYKLTLSGSTGASLTAYVLPV